jgi:gluconolactonase
MVVNGPAGPDGLAMDVSGGLAVAIAGRGEAWILDRRADPVLVLRSVTGPSVTNLAYGGPDRRDVYCTESATGTILRARVETPGCPVPVGRP